MALQLSRREVEELRSSLDRAIYRTLGHSDSALLSTVSSCLSNGYERRKIIDKITSHTDPKKASKLADKVLALAEELISNAKSSSSKKRSHEAEPAKEAKRARAEKHERERHEDKKHDEKSNSHHTNGSAKESKEKEKEKKKPTVMGVDVASAEGESVGSEIAGLSASRIKLMMANAQKEIEERKRALTELKAGEPPAEPPPPPPPSHPAVSAAILAAQQIKQQIRLQNQHDALAPSGLINPMLFSKPAGALSQAEYDKQRKIAELQARIQRKLEGGALAAAPARPAPLILDRDGRTVDNAGRRVTLTHVAPTLKANIRAKRREEFRAQLSAGMAEAEVSAADARWHDERVAARPAARAKRSLRFFEPGKFKQMAERLRMKAQLEKLQSEISQIARKTGISSATKLALLAADAPDADRVPDIEWWDSIILMTAEERAARGTEPRSDEASEADAARVEACNTGARDIVDNLNVDAITNLVEHPQQCRPPNEPLKATYMPVFLTRAERKKLRRQNRREAWKEEQEKVRLGLEAPAEPKLRISNLMRALGTEAVQDPTAIEAKVREQMAKRQRTHREANEARALTREQRKEKADRRIQEDTTAGVHVAVYRVRDLFECASHKFKVERNACQLHMTGCVLLHRGCCVVVVEGGPRQHAKYKRLMLQRIKWGEDTVKDGEGQDVANSCALVWEGTAQARAFGEIKFKVVPTEKLAREHFQKHKVEQYWDLAYSGAVLDTTGF